MKFRHLLLLPCLAWAGHVHAEIYKRVDADGNVTYSNRPIKGGRKIDIGPLPTVQSTDEHNTSYERVKRTTQRSRDDARRRVLEDELAAEEKLLVQARQNLKDVTDPPPNMRAAGGTFRDSAEQEGEIKHAQEQVDLHERNVKAIRQELSSIK